MEAHDVIVPATVPADMRKRYIDNFLQITRSTGRLMLFAGDQKIEHLNSDFYGEGIAYDDSEPEHLFRIASEGTVGCFAAQLGLVARYAQTYDKINYLVKMNSKTNLVKHTDPYSSQLYQIDDVLRLRNNGVKVLGVGYTIYLGSEFESLMLREAAGLITEAHKAGLLVVLWIYPRGKSVTREKDAHLIAGACGTAASLGADFVKVNYPQETGHESKEVFKEAVRAGGRCGVVCAGGSSQEPFQFLNTLWEQIHASGARGSATGRNIHQKALPEAVRMCNAISSVVLGDKDPGFALAVFEGREDFRL